MDDGNRERLPASRKLFMSQVMHMSLTGKEVIPVLLMTGYPIQQKNSQVHADDIIEKPFNLNLKRRVEKLIA